MTNTTGWNRNWNLNKKKICWLKNRNLKQSDTIARHKNRNLQPKNDLSVKELELKTDRYINVSRLYRSIQSEDRHRKIDQSDLSPTTADMLLSLCNSLRDYTVKKGLPFSRPQPGCHWLNSPWAGIMTSYINYSRPGRVSSVTSRLGTVKRLTLFYSVSCPCLALVLAAYTFDLLFLPITGI